LRRETLLAVIITALVTASLVAVITTRLPRGTRTATVTITSTLTKPETITSTLVSTVSTTLTRTVTVTAVTTTTEVTTITATITQTSTSTSTTTPSTTSTTPTVTTTTTVKPPATPYWASRPAVMYENLYSPPEGFEKALSILSELRPGMVWYSRMITGFPPVPNATSAYAIGREAGLSDAQARKFAAWVQSERYDLEDIGRAAKAVEELGALYCPCILVQNLRVSFNYDPLTFKPIPKSELESMALDYSKWGLPYDKDKTQEYFREKAGIPAGAVFPDITNEAYQEYLIRKVKALKEAGVKCVWLDMLFAQANIAYAITHDYNHPAVKEAYEAAVKVVKEIKAMGMTVGTWADWVIYPYSNAPPVDFVTKTVSRKEVMEGSVNLTEWREVISTIRGRTNATILMVFDFGPSDNTPLAIFSQQLTPEQQTEFLKSMGEACKELGVVPVYPVHGGCMGRDAQKLSYGKYLYYDALAPEFRTYETIKELMSG